MISNRRAFMGAAATGALTGILARSSVGADTSQDKYALLDEVLGESVLRCGMY